MESLKNQWTCLINWKGWESIKKWKISKLIKNKIIWNTVIIITLLVFILLVIYYFQPIAKFFFTSNNRNGELFKVILSVFGGIGLFYGLYLNSKRIQEQTRQNNISQSSNSDSRFGEAIGYLGDDNTSIILGGIYSLYQLAKEDSRYRPIVANLFASYLQDKSKILYDKYENENKKNTQLVPIIVKTIIDLLFGSENLFKGVKLEFSNCYFKNIDIISEVRNCSFSSCVFISSTLKGNISDCSFNRCELLNHSTLGSEKSFVKNCDFFILKTDHMSIIGKSIDSLNFNFLEIDTIQIVSESLTNCNFFLMAGQSSRLKIYNVKSFIGTRIAKEEKKFLVFDTSCKNIDQIEYF